MKMAEIKPFMERYKEKARIAQMTGNKALSVEAAKEFKEVRIKKGIDNFYNLINVIQLPFLITWFLSLRYVTAMPEIFPETMEPFLWMDNICSYDPYFIFPLVSACLSSYSIMLSPALNRNVAMPILQPFIKYMKYPIAYTGSCLSCLFQSLGSSQQPLISTGAHWLQPK